MSELTSATMSNLTDLLATREFMMMMKNWKSLIPKTLPTVKVAETAPELAVNT